MRLTKSSAFCGVVVCLVVSCVLCVWVRLGEDTLKILVGQGVTTVEQLGTPEEADIEQAFALHAAGKITLLREGLG